MIIAPVVEAVDELTLAIITSSYVPLLLLDGELKIMAASSSFCHDFEIAPATVSGRTLAALGGGEWNIPQVRSLLESIASGHAEVDAYEIDLVRTGRSNRRLVLNARKLQLGDANMVRLLLSVSDVTDARLANETQEDMLRDKELLLQELQHRVANSLQIIASVLMQSARRVQSDETRTHLYDAHHRVMSVAAVQKQLALARLGDVELGPYFTELCRSISASMIRDQNELTLTVTADDSVTAPDASVSLGLIVTELVINAIKHAFPGQRGGSIIVDYRSEGPAWTLSVGDDGVGMPTDPDSFQAGLGSSIVEAIAKQLGARVEIADTHPGTRVSIIHP